MAPPTIPPTAPGSAMEPPILEPSWKIYRLDDRDKVYAPGVEKNGRDKINYHLKNTLVRALIGTYMRIITSGRYLYSKFEAHCVHKFSRNILLPHKMYFGVLLSGGHVGQHVPMLDTGI